MQKLIRLLFSIVILTLSSGDILAEESCCCSNLPNRYNLKLPSSPTGMLWTPGGEFTMGSISSDSLKDEGPAHRGKSG